MISGRLKIRVMGGLTDPTPDLPRIATRAWMADMWRKRLTEAPLWCGLPFKLLAVFHHSKCAANRVVDRACVLEETTTIKADRGCKEDGQPKRAVPLEPICRGLNQRKKTNCAIACGLKQKPISGLNTQPIWKMIEANSQLNLSELGRRVKARNWARWGGTWRSNLLVSLWSYKQHGCC